MSKMVESTLELHAKQHHFVTLGKSSNLSGPQFLHLSTGKIMPMHCHRAPGSPLQYQKDDN